MSLATVTTLERKVNELENTIRELTGAPSEKEKVEAHYEQMAARAAERAQDTGAGSFVRQQVEQQRQHELRVLTGFGVAEDDDNLKRTVLFLFGPEFPFRFAQNRFAALALTLAGAKVPAEPGIKDIVAAWPKINPSTQAAIAEVARAYAMKREL